MRGNSMAHFEEVRLQNKKAIRNLMREYTQIGKGELVKLSGLSFPTISAILRELVEAGEVCALSEPVSNGGRPAELYTLNTNFKYAICGIFSCLKIEWKVYDVRGDILEEREIDITEQLDIGAILEELVSIKNDYPKLSAVALGIPGVVLDGTIKYLPHLPKLEGVNIKEEISRQLGMDVFVENDINMIAYAERKKWGNLGHIFLNKGCIGVGIILDGQLIRGVHGMAGELERVCKWGEDDVYSYLARSITLITSVVDVPDIALSGEDIEGIELQTLVETIARTLPLECIPKLHKVAHEEELYQMGLWSMILETWQEQI